MKYLIFIFFILISGCIENDSNEFKKSCPYDLKYSGHYLKVPITITPHKINYNIGDTIKISTIFSDSIYDLGTEKKKLKLNNSHLSLFLYYIVFITV